jgi:hypothetical protein
MQVSPNVRFFTAANTDGFVRIVRPVETKAVTSDGTWVATRVQLPLCSGIAMKYGFALGAQFDTVRRVFADITKVAAAGATQPFLALTRVAHPSLLALPVDAAVSGSMFSPPKECVDWHEGEGWEQLRLTYDDNRKTHQGISYARVFQKRMCLVAAPIGDDEPEYMKSVVS